MRRLKHLLWVVPLLLIAAAIVLSITTANAREADTSYHATLSRSIQVTSNDFGENMEMPEDLSCRGSGRAPHIAWSGGPAGVRSYVLLATDWDAPSPSLPLFAVPHWVVYNIPPDVKEIPANSTTAQLTQSNIAVGAGIGGEQEYIPPCPPLGQHRYEFRIYGLDIDRIEPASNNKDGVLAAIEGHVLGYGELVGLNTAP
jgi:Raf kinase inhibitor-like YbhB/YbcL family protein